MSSEHGHVQQVSSLKLDLLQALVVVVSYSRRMHLSNLQRVRANVGMRNKFLHGELPR